MSQDKGQDAGVLTPEELLIALRAEPHTETFSGGFYVFRKKRGFKWKIGGFRMPWYQHATLDSATTEAARLVTLFPDSTFVVMQAVATVKMEPNSTDGGHKDIVI